MSALTRCKKLIEEEQNKAHKPTISHYRDRENGMLKTKNPTKKIGRYTWELVFSDFNNGVQIWEKQKTKASPVAYSVVKAGENPTLNGSYLRFETAVKKAGSFKNPAKLPVVSNPLANYGAAIKRLPVGSTLRGELSRIYSELKTVTAESKGKHANKDYYRPRIKQLTEALKQGLRAAKNPTVKKTVVTKKVTTVKKSNPRTITGGTSLGHYNKDGERYEVQILANDKFAKVKARGRLWSDWIEVTNGIIKHTNVWIPVKDIIYKNGTAKRANNATHTDFKRYQKVQLDQLIRMFRGKRNGLNKRYLEPDTAPPNKGELGFLRLLKVRRNGQMIPIIFENESILSADHLKRFWIVGRDSIIENGSLRAMGVKKPAKGDLALIGNLHQIDYVTDKAHIENGETVHFWHKTGEVDKVRAQLYIDHDGFPIIHGGNYDIWDVGIVN